MGYLSHGEFIQFLGQHGAHLQDEILDEAKRLYEREYGKRSPDTVSSMELDRIVTEAGKIIQQRRRQQHDANR